MTTAELTKIYIEIGALGLAFIILMFVFILFAKNSIKKSNDQADLIKKLLEEKDKQNSELIKQIVTQVSSHTPSPQETKVANIISKSIDEQLQSLLNDTKASRAVFIQYHNGTRGFSKHSFMKMSCTNEAHVSNVKPLTPTFQDQMKSLFNKALLKLDETGEYSVENLEDIKDEDGSMYWFMSIREDKQAFHLSIKDKYGNPIGYLLLIYANNNPITATKEMVIPRMLSTKALIEYILQSNQDDKNGEE